MVFSVKYRDYSGAVCEKAVEAANRADCFAKCKAQGIVPIAVESGSAVAKKGGYDHGSAAGSKPKAPNAKLVLLVGTLVAIGAVVWF
jgi:type II secretory pathway component PulF